METIMTPKFMHSIEKIITEVRAITDIDEAHVEALKELLESEFNIEEYHNAISSARSKAYDDGFEDGFDVGYDNGYSNSHSAV